MLTGVISSIKGALNNCFNANHLKAIEKYVGMSYSPFMEIREALRVFFYFFIPYMEVLV